MKVLQQIIKIRKFYIEKKRLKCIKLQMAIAIGAFRCPSGLPALTVPVSLQDIKDPTRMAARPNLAISGYSTGITLLLVILIRVREILPHQLVLYLVCYRNVHFFLISLHLSFFPFPT